MTEKRILDYILDHKRLLAILFGIAFILLSLIIETTDPFYGNSILVSLLRELGVTFIIIGTILVSFERHLNSYFENSLENLENKLDEILENVNITLHGFKLSGRLINEGMESGIVNIFLNRNTLEFQNRLHDELVIADGEILIIGIALGDFFNGGRLYDAMRTRIEENRCNIHIKALLLNPLSRAARERARVENGEIYYDIPTYYNCRLFTDITGSMNSIKDLLDKIKTNGFNCKMEIKFYDTDPQLYMIMINNNLFLEQYHLGKLNIGCIGRHVPVLEVEEKVFEDKEVISYYSVTKKHFDYLWNRKETKNLSDVDKCIKYDIKESCQVKE